MEIRRKRCFVVDGMLPPTVNYYIPMDNYAKSFRLFPCLGVCNILATGVPNKKRLRKCTIIRNTQLQKKECGHFNQHTSSKTQCNFDSD